MSYVSGFMMGAAIGKGLRQFFTGAPRTAQQLGAQACQRGTQAYQRGVQVAAQVKRQAVQVSQQLSYDFACVSRLPGRRRYRAPLTPESIEITLNDVAGVRVICSFITDIDLLADAFLRQDDIRLLERKDYIRNPKPNGYRSLHLIVEIPIFLHDQKRLMKVEVQLRTTAMDWWASAEHKIRYKKDLDPDLLKEIDQELLEGARIGAELDEKMAQIHRKVIQRGTEVSP